MLMLQILIYELLVASPLSWKVVRMRKYLKEGLSAYISEFVEKNLDIWSIIVGKLYPVGIPRKISQIIVLLRGQSSDGLNCLDFMIQNHGIEERFGENCDRTDRGRAGGVSRFYSGSYSLG